MSAVVHIKRGYHSGDVTLGMLEIEGLELPPIYTLELPWRENARGVSCIPAGWYNAVPHTGGRFRDVWRLEDVPGRSAILIHAGNTVDDIEGCILVGSTHGQIGDKHAVLQSKAALNKLRDALGINNKFTVVIS